MLQCAIPKCGGHEKSLRSGTLHLVDSVRGDGRVSKKIVWLCESCTEQYTVQTWRAPGEQIRLRSSSGTFSAADVFSEGLEELARKPPKQIKKLGSDSRSGSARSPTISHGKLV
jgi:hypothetical protein